MKKSLKYLPVTFLIFTSCVFFRNQIVGYVLEDKLDFQITIGDYIANFFCGDIPYSMTSKDKPFDIPAIWSFYFIYFFALISWRIGDMYAKVEYQVAIRMGKRKKWNMKNAQKLLKVVTLYYSLTYACFLAFGICTKAEFEGPNAATQLQFCGIDLSNFRRYELVMYLVIVPFFVLWALAYMHYMISIYANTVIGFLFLVVLLVASVFYLHPLLFGNYVMMARSEKILSDGIHLGVGVMVSVIEIIISFVIGNEVIEKKDLF